MVTSPKERNSEFGWFFHSNLRPEDANNLNQILITYFFDNHGQLETVLNISDFLSICEIMQSKCPEC